MDMSVGSTEVAVVRALSAVVCSQAWQTINCQAVTTPLLGQLQRVKVVLRSGMSKSCTAVLQVFAVSYVTALVCVEQHSCLQVPAVSACL
jgi:hypothetical protein